MIPANVMKALTAWVSVDTWHSFHPSDRDRFVKFVEALFDVQFKNVEEIRKAIVEETREWHPNFNRDEMSKIVDRWIRELRDIYKWPE